jgi:hypothetical protein
MGNGEWGKRFSSIRCAPTAHGVSLENKAEGSRAEGRRDKDFHSFLVGARLASRLALLLRTMLPFGTLRERKRCFHA